MIRFGTVFSLDFLPSAGRVLRPLTAGVWASYDTENGRCVAAGLGANPIGAAVAPAGNGGSTVCVRLDGISTGAA
jgi:hypothetical protein